MAIDKWDRLEVAATNTFGSSTTLVISSFHLVELGIIIIFIIIRHWVGDRWHRLDGTGSKAQARWHRLEGTGSMAQAWRHRHDAQAQWHRLEGTGLKAQAWRHRLEGTGTMHRHYGTGTSMSAYIQQDHSTNGKTFIPSVLREWHTSWTSHNRQDRCLV